MAHAGPPPKPNKIGRSPTADWTDVPDRPYAGPSPDLPKLPKSQRWHQPVAEWWETVRRMPHCVLWQESDWRYAIEAAYLRNAFWAQFSDGEIHTTMATELRRRDDNMGTTVEARRKLRVRYIDPALFDDELDGGASAAGAGGKAGGTVTDLVSRRKRLTG